MLRVLTLKCTPQRAGPLVSSGDLETPGHSRFESSEIAKLPSQRLGIEIYELKKRSEENFVLENTIRLYRGR